tara:strand:+ start:3614 stop:4267 length:654 start_codon:yes stop_codon:yes gene_type:complete
MKITSKYLKRLIQEELYKRKVMVHEIRDMGEDLVLDMNARRIEKAITRARLRTIIKEETRRIIKEESRRLISPDSFPALDVEGWVDRQDPLDGLTAMNGKLNTLMSLIMVLNDNVASRGDLRDLRDEFIDSEVQFDGASMARIDEQRDPDTIHASWPSWKGDPEAKADELLSILFKLTGGQFTVNEEEFRSLQSRIEDLESLVRGSGAGAARIESDN